MNHTAELTAQQAHNYVLIGVVLTIILAGLFVTALWILTRDNQE